LKKLVLVGGGGHCESVINMIESSTNYEILGILEKNKSGLKILGYPILGGDDLIPSFVKENHAFVITVGQIKSSAIRRKLYNLIKLAGGDLPIIISSKAIVSKHTQIEEGTVVMQCAIINANTKIGKCSIINTQANIEHGVTIGHFNHIATSTTINGNVVINENTFIGSKAVVNQECHIGKHVVVASGTVVRKNIENDVIYLG